MAFSPAAERNKAPILSILRQYLESGNHVLEIASGTGQHVIHFAQSLSETWWQPTDRSDGLFSHLWAEITAHGLTNVARPRVVDVTEPWGGTTNFDAIYCANMIHIAPWQAAEGLFSIASTRLAPRGQLLLYGPFRFHDQLFAESNQRFHESLRARNPSWGVRDIEAVDALGEQTGFVRNGTHSLPSNNHLLVYERR